MINVLSLPNLKSRSESNIKLVGMAYHMGLELSGTLVPRPSLSLLLGNERNAHNKEGTYGSLPEHLVCMVLL